MRRSALPAQHPHDDEGREIEVHPKVPVLNVGRSSLLTTSGAAVGSKARVVAVVVQLPADDLSGAVVWVPSPSAGGTAAS